jgi:hypothetical protein
MIKDVLNSSIVLPDDQYAGLSLEYRPGHDGEGCFLLQTTSNLILMRGLGDYAYLHAQLGFQLKISY